MLLLTITAALTVAVGVVALLATDPVWTRYDSLLALVLTPFHTLLSVAIGWYFAEKRSS